MSDFKLTTPVAFIIFNRPDTTERVFAEIAKAKPSKLLVVADGPRPHKEGEAEKVKATRAIIQRVDWPCEVLTNYSEKNLGCKVRVSSGIDWVFEHVEEAIILEDDCLPDQTFFRFCQEMLWRYRNDQRVGMISGDNFQFGKKRNNDSYYFSKYVHIWGWATWRDRWKTSYDVEMKKWPLIRDGNWLVDMLGSKEEVSGWNTVFELTHVGKIDTWDYQWMFAIWLGGYINIIPNINLISNIGFGADATHTIHVNNLANLETCTMDFPLVHPVGIFKNTQADFLTYQRCIRNSYWKNISSKLYNFFFNAFNFYGRK